MNKIEKNWRIEENKKISIQNRIGFFDLKKYYWMKSENQNNLKNKVIFLESKQNIGFKKKQLGDVLPL